MTKSSRHALGRRVATRVLAAGSLVFAALAVCATPAFADETTDPVQPYTVQAWGVGAPKVGDPQTINATVEPSADAADPAGGSVHFVVSGASGDLTGDSPIAADHSASFTYTGTTVGNDTVLVCYDIDQDSSCGAEEPSVQIVVPYLADIDPDDAVHPGGPYVGTVGEPVAISGWFDGEDIEMHDWFVQDSDSCTFADRYAYETTVTCTAAGDYILELIVGGLPLSKTTTLTITEAAPTDGDGQNPPDDTECPGDGNGDGTGGTGGGDGGTGDGGTGGDSTGGDGGTGGDSTGGDGGTGSQNPPDSGDNPPASPTPPAQPSTTPVADTLPKTGTDVSSVAIVGVLFIVTGTAAVIGGRRRRADAEG